MAVYFLVLMLLPGLTARARAVDPGKTAITTEQIRSLVQAVQDEIYDYGFEEDYVGIGTDRAVDGAKWKSEMPIYVKPTIEDGRGVAIYDLKHYGEVYRIFSIGDNGRIILDGDPELGFPPTQSSLLTKYMRGSEIAQMKHDWLHETYNVNTAPSNQTVRDSAQRQKLRTGFSYWESFVLPRLSKTAGTKSDN